MSKVLHSKIIKEEALRLGFSHCGFSKAEFLKEEAPRLEQWLLQNMHGKMAYMEKHFDKRLDPTKLVPDAKSIISLLLNYFPAEEQQDKTAPKISRYAFGRDYHFVIKDKLAQLFQFIHDKIGKAEGRVFVDSAPVLDKAWAKRSGLGWTGKNTNLINPKAGSYFFIAELIVDLELEYDSPMEDYCGTCNRCVEACPTEAIIQPYVVDGSKCISYFTIELKEAIPVEVQGKFDNWVFGCDVCQEVCPWNRFSAPHSEAAFNAKEDLIQMTKKEWHEITEEVFEKIFYDSAVKRAGYEGLKRNLAFISE